MKFVAVFIVLCISAVALSAPLDDSKNAVITGYENDNIGIEGYKFHVETSDGKSFAEEGELKDAGTDDEGIAVKGQYSYTGPDGVVYSVSYVADKNGFQPVGDHIPKV
ncbi:flexible cuticle protein 12-like [Episyrphus balteatus]|uniref:flexible cuticle protein 12-like n=1 Tax=Episyrphus balteatus TaxID=286459 RepID=UPI0024855876|nr:flexible cuticle protein 12-like [Episyrphus balteatus]